MESHDGIIEWCEENGVTCENPYEAEFAWLWEDWEEELLPDYWGL
tara:strand:- start:52 stop:186 length:135 start_codon:yes stop_codon:yes gene_type:complete